MEIAGKNFEKNSVINRVKNECNKILSDLGDGMWLVGEPTDEEDICQQIEASVWSYLLQSIADLRCQSVSAEKAVAEVIRYGETKPNTWFRKNSFRIELQNRRYIVYKNDGFFSAVPYLKGRKCRLCACPAKNVSAEAFAELVYCFDSIVPEIEAAVAPYLEEYKLILMQRRREEIAKMMAEKSVETLINEYVRPLGLQSDYSISGDRIRINLVQRKEATVEASLDELADILKDGKALMDSLETVVDEPAESYGKGRLFNFNPFKIGRI